MDNEMLDLPGIAYFDSGYVPGRWELLMLGRPTFLYPTDFRLSGDQLRSYAFWLGAAGAED